MSAVVQIVTALERGGAQRTVLDAAVRLHDPHRPQYVVTGGRGAALDEEAEAALGRRLLRVPSLVGPVAPLEDARALAALGRLLDDLRRRVGTPIVVHTSSSKAGVLGRLAGRSVRGAKVIHTVHGFGLDAHGGRAAWALEAAERVAAPAADVLVFVSTSDVRRARELGLLRPADVFGGRVRVIRSGIDPRPFAALVQDADRRRAARARFGLGPVDVVATTIANMKPQKDPLFHVDVLAAWRRRVPSAKLLFVGDGPLRAAMIERARAAGVLDALVLPGFLADAQGAYAAADVALLASAWEGLPRAVLEAIAAGLPVVVRDTGYGDDLDWAKALIAVPISTTSPTAADALADALVTATSGRRRKRAPKLPREFTLDGTLQDLDILYDELLGRARWM